MTNRIWVVATAMVTIAILALGWFLGAAPRLAEAAEATDQRIAATAVNDEQVAAIAALKDEFESIDAIRAELDELRLSLPAEVDLDGFIDQIGAAAAANGVAVTGFTAEDPAVFAVLAPDAPVVAEVTPEESSDEAGPESPATVEGADVAVPAVTDALVSPENFITLKVGMTVEGAFDDVVGFVADMQRSPRLFLVANLNIGTTEAATTGIVEGLIYVLIDPTLAVAPESENSAETGATPETPTNTPTPTPTATGMPTPVVTEAPVP
jgi:Tfp pilus assembly protein PilO